MIVGSIPITLQCPQTWLAGKSPTMEVLNVNIIIELNMIFQPQNVDYRRVKHIELLAQAD
jgi:hypothetical protein